MNNPSYYDILEANVNTPIHVIKQLYHKAALKYHPDKLRERNSDANETSQFNRIKEAYDVLSQAEKRREYDKQLLAREHESERRISDEVDLEDMRFIPSLSSYSYPCRCGEYYQISEEELENGINIVECNGCSLLVRVLYEQVVE